MEIAELESLPAWECGLKYKIRKESFQGHERHSLRGSVD